MDTNVIALLDLLSRAKAVEAVSNNTTPWQYLPTIAIAVFALAGAITSLLTWFKTSAIHVEFDGHMTKLLELTEKHGVEDGRELQRAEQLGGKHTRTGMSDEDIAQIVKEFKRLK